MIKYILFKRSKNRPYLISKLCKFNDSIYFIWIYSCRFTNVGLCIGILCCFIIDNRNACGINFTSMHCEGRCSPLKVSSSVLVLVLIKMYPQVEWMRKGEKPMKSQTLWQGNSLWSPQLAWDGNRQWREQARGAKRGFELIQQTAENSATLSLTMGILQWLEILLWIHSNI